MKLLIKHKNYEWVIDAHSFELGVIHAHQLQERIGLIGRTYIESESGKSTWI
jgi:hypothetical protein